MTISHVCLLCTGAVELEDKMISWISRGFCLPITAGGVLTADCRTSTVVAFITAKQRKHKPSPAAKRSFSPLCNSYFNDIEYYCL